MKKLDLDRVYRRMKPTREFEERLHLEIHTALSFHTCLGRTV